MALPGIWLGCTVIPTATLTLTPGIGVEWNSDNQNEYYYGVSKHESNRSGMRSYDPDSSWNPYLELAANYRFLGDWSVYGIARYTRLSDEITDSPMVDKSPERPDFDRDHLYLLTVHFHRLFVHQKQGVMPLFLLYYIRVYAGWRLRLTRPTGRAHYRPSKHGF